MITEPLNRTIREHGSPNKTQEHELLTAAKLWSIHSLDTYKGELLRRALAISVSLSEFTAELQEPSAPAESEID